MSHHSQSNSHCKQMISDVVSIAMSHIQDIALKLKDLDITEANLATKSKEVIDKSILLNNILMIINDVVHPVHELSKELYPGAVDFIDMCIENHKRAIEKKMISPLCNCYTCKMKSVVKE